MDGLAAMQVLLGSVRAKRQSARRMLDPEDPELIEELARSSYYRDRFEDMVVDKEHAVDDDAQYFCYRWESLSGAVQRPYRVAVRTTLKHVAELVAA